MQINQEVKENIHSSSFIVSDGYKGYNHLKKVVSGRIWTTVSPEKAGKVFPLVHIAISNAKRNLLNTYHQVDQKYMQNYLNEYCYKLNRRYFGERLFERLFIACASFSYVLGS